MTVQICQVKQFSRIIFAERQILSKPANLLIFGQGLVVAKLQLLHHHLPLQINLRISFQLPSFKVCLMFPFIVTAHKYLVNLGLFEAWLGISFPSAIWQHTLSIDGYRLFLTLCRPGLLENLWALFSTSSRLSDRLLAVVFLRRLVSRKTYSNLNNL